VGSLPATPAERDRFWLARLSHAAVKFSTTGTPTTVPTGSTSRTWPSREVRLDWVASAPALAEPLLADPPRLRQRCASYVCHLVVPADQARGVRVLPVPTRTTATRCARRQSFSPTPWSFSQHRTRRRRGARHRTGPWWWCPVATRPARWLAVASFAAQLGVGVGGRHG
jgi:hypothetical protein